MIRRLMDKFIRIVYDDLKVFLVFFLLMQVGELYVDIRVSFLITLGFSMYAFLINGYLKSDRFQKLMPLLGILSSFIVTMLVYKDHTTLDKGIFIFYHLLIWLVGARNLRERIMAKRTMMYVFLPVIITTVILFAVYFTGVNLEVVLGQIYPFLLMFYAVTFMLAVKLNLDQGYNTVNKTVNTINKRTNRGIYSVLPMVIIFVIFAFVLTRNFEVVQSVQQEVVEELSDETSDEIVLVPDQEEEEVVYKENKTTGKKQEQDDKDKNNWTIRLESKLLSRTVVEVLGLLGMMYVLYKFFKKIHNKKIEEDEDEFLEVRESLLTKENIKRYLDNLKDKLKKKHVVPLPRIRALYRNQVMRQIKKGRLFGVSDTPKEYASDVHDEAFKTLTRTYEDHRYGEKQFTDREINDLETKLNDK